MKDRIITWLKAILGIVALQQGLEREKEKNRILLKKVGFLETENKKFNSLVKVGVDIHAGHRHSRGGSWAVVAIEGEKQDFVQFVDLDSSEIREVASFLRRFDKRSAAIDRPIGMRKDWFFE